MSTPTAMPQSASPSAIRRLVTRLRAGWRILVANVVWFHIRGGLQV